MSLARLTDSWPILNHGERWWLRAFDMFHSNWSPTSCLHYPQGNKINCLIQLSFRLRQALFIFKRKCLVCEVAPPIGSPGHCRVKQGDSVECTKPSSNFEGAHKFETCGCSVEDKALPVGPCHTSTDFLDVSRPVCEGQDFLAYLQLRLLHIR